LEKLVESDYPTALSTEHRLSVSPEARISG
jgi:hypothetical protein